MIQICIKDYCTGCYACYNACPSKAIKMVEKEPFGHMYPIIIKNRCSDCKKCIKVCPVNNPIKTNKNAKCFAAKAADETQYENSSSGGIGSLLVENHIINNGIAYCATFNDNLELVHKQIKTKQDIKKASGSKYVQSNIGNTYKKIEKDLKNNNKVLFIGTPCQVAGLLSFIGKNNINLTTVDFVCHGVPSQKMLKEQVNEVSNETIIDNILFRDKKDSFLYNFILIKNNNIVFKQNGNLNPYLFLFLKGLTFREACYKCPFANTKRVSDITIGDFWGLPQSSKLYAEESAGTSLVLINSKNGENTFKQLSTLLILEEQNLKTACIENSQLRHASVKPNKYKKLINYYKKCNNLKKTLKNTFRLRYIKNFIIFR